MSEDPDVYDMYMCNGDACGWAGMGWECVHPKHDDSLRLCPRCHETTMHLPQEEAVQLIRSLRSEVADLTGRLETL